MSTRRTRGRKNNNEDALAALKAARSGDTSRIDQFEVKEEEDVYDEISQKEYERLVAERREMNDFVVDDDGLYADDGEEDIWDDVGGVKKRRKTKGNRQRRKKRVAEVKKIDARFLRGGATAAMASVDGENGDDAMIDSLLEGLDEDADDNAVEGGLDSSKLQDMAIFAPRSKISDGMNIEELAEAEQPAPRRNRKRVHSSAVEEPEYEEPEPELSVQPDDDSEEEAMMDTETEVVMRDEPNEEEADEDEEYDDAVKETVDGGKKIHTGGADVKFASPAQPRNVASNKAFDNVSNSKSALLAEDGELMMYYYDAYFERFSNDATVYLFGKAIMGTNNKDRKSVSVCLSVENMERSLFVRPRKYWVDDPADPTSKTTREVQMIDVYNELKGIMKRNGVKKWAAKKATRNFCFEQPRINKSNSDGKVTPAISASEEFFKVVYSFEFPALHRNTKGKTFEFIFGTGSSKLELLLLKRELMGPCWIKVKNAEIVPSSSSVSWCKHEFKIKSHKCISKFPSPQPPPPPFSLMSLSLKTVLNQKTHGHEIAVASLKYLSSVEIDSPLPKGWQGETKEVSVACKLEGKAWPYDLLRVEQRQGKKIIKQGNERALLSFLTNKISAWDPDIIVAHELHGFVIDVLVNRMQHHKVQYWSRVGRLKKSRFPRAVGRGGLSLIDFGVGSGRLMVDTQVSAKELVRENTYTLSHLAKSRLDEYRQDIQSADVALAYNTGESLIKLINHTENDGILSIKLMDKLQVVPLTKQLTTICGNQWSRSLRSARAERVEYLLLHRFHNLKYIVPEKLTGREKKEKIAAKNKELGIVDQPGKKRKKPKYEGGLVLEPKKGFYDKYVLLLDFNSLYPSIILEFDLCFTTVRHWEPKNPGEYVDLPARQSEHQGTLPKVIKQLLSRRKVVKQLMKNERNAAKKKVLDIRQKAIKLVANSMYGCLGFSSSRFFCQPLAALITAQGRSILEKTKQLAENSLGMQVIYGDTDSIMVYTDSTNYDEVFKIGHKVKQEVNKLYRDLTIDIDGVFKKMLLLRKKKYAALTISRNPDGLLVAEKESKGLDLVRRDWSPISKSTGNYVLDRILSDAPREEVVDKILAHLSEIKESIIQNKLPLGRYVVTKGLTKHPNDYPDAKSQPHVMVAKRMIAQNRPVRAGSYIPYIICEGDKTLSQRAYHIDEVRSSKGKLKIDQKWYFENQLFPPIARLCAPIKEIGAAQIAASLGLDGKKFARYDKDETAAEEVVFSTVASVQDDKERFKSAERLKIPCGCGIHRKFEGIFDFESGKSGLDCPSRSCPGLGTPAGKVKIMNTIALALRDRTSKYYDGWFQCTNQVCGRITRTLPTGSPKCWSCFEPLKQRFTDLQMYTQLCYFQSLFDKERAQKNLVQENKRRVEAGLPEWKIKLTLEQEKIIDEIHGFVTKQYVQRSGYNYINLENLFSFNFA